jgi:hypothetical protein
MNCNSVFVDLDGCLVDFERGFELFHGMKHNEIPEEEMWKRIAEHETHWHDLPPMPGAIRLWSAIQHRNPIILTALPRTGTEQAEIGKREWCKRELGEKIEVITTFSDLKQEFMRKKGDLLIDDNSKNCFRWEQAGGVAIHYDWQQLEKYLYMIDEWLYKWSI